MIYGIFAPTGSRYSRILLTKGELSDLKTHLLLASPFVLFFCCYSPNVWFAADAALIVLLVGYLKHMLVGVEEASMFVSACMRMAMTMACIAVCFAG